MVIDRCRQTDMTIDRNSHAHTLDFSDKHIRHRCMSDRQNKIRSFGFETTDSFSWTHGTTENNNNMLTSEPRILKYRSSNYHSMIPWEQTRWRMFSLLRLRVRCHSNVPIGFCRQYHACGKQASGLAIGLHDKFHFISNLHVIGRRPAGGDEVAVGCQMHATSSIPRHRGSEMHATSRTQRHSDNQWMQRTKHRDTAQGNKMHIQGLRMIHRDTSSFLTYHYTAPSLDCGCAYGCWPFLKEVLCLWFSLFNVPYGKSMTQWTGDAHSSWDVFDKHTQTRINQSTTKPTEVFCMLHEQ